jgi:imidazolonepropionase-like amidohydrolase
LLADNTGSHVTFDLQEEVPMLRAPHLLRFAVILLLAASLGGGTLAQQESERTLINNVRVWDGKADSLTGTVSILVRGNLVERIADGEQRVPEGTTVIDGGGRVVIPGLIDVHQHLSMVSGINEMRNKYDWMYVGSVAGAEAGKMLLRGFTTVRDLGGPTVGLAKAIDEGRIPGPRIFSSGAFITQTSGHGDFRNPNDPHPTLTGEKHIMDRLGWVHIADGVDEVTRAAREVLFSGATQLKLMAGGGVASDYDPIEAVQYTPEELRAAVTAAANYGTYVAVHAYTDAAIRQALEAGVMCIDHGMLIEEETMILLKEKGAFLSPQTYIFSGNIDFDWFTDENRRKLRQVESGLDNEMKLAKKHGVKVVFGTDMFNEELFPLQNRDLGLRLQWFSSPEVLRQATSVAAELLSLSTIRNPYKEGALGVVAEGGYADLLVVEGNPLKDVRVLEDHEANLRLIMKDGKVYKNTL